MSLSDLTDLCAVLDKKDVLLLLQAKLPHALRLANIVRSMPSSMPKVTKDALMGYYFKKFGVVGEIDIERYVNILLFCTDDQLKPLSDVREMEILAPPTSNCFKCKSQLVSQNKICTVTLFTIESVKTVMKLSCRCKDCKLNYGYSMFGNVEEGYHFYKEERPYVEASDDVFVQRRLCLFQASLA